MTPTTVRDNLKALSAYLIESSGPDFMYEAVEQAIALLGEREWQPIETAPKDGTRVLIYYRWAHRDRFISEGWWSERTQQWNAPHNTMVRATHWQPLPPAPTGIEPGRGV